MTIAELSALGYRIEPSYQPDGRIYTLHCPDGKTAVSVLDTNLWAVARYRERMKKIGR